MISFVCIYSEADSHYLSEMIKSIPKNCELLLFEMKPSNLELVTFINQNDNIKQYTFLYESDKFSFSHFRNRAKNYAKYDIIFTIDSDERLLIQNDEVEKIKELFDNDNEIGGMLVNIINFSFENGGLQKHIAPTVRIFRKKFNYENLVHESIENDIARNNCYLADSSVIIKHIGYMTSFENNFNRMQRNVILMYKDLSNNPENLYLENKLINSLSVLNEMRRQNDNNK